MPNVSVFKGSMSRFCTHRQVGESYRCTHAPARQRSMYTANVPHSFLGVPVNLQFSAFAARTRPTLVARNAFHGAIDAPSFTCLLESLAPMPVLESKLPLTMRFSPPYDGNAAAAQIAAIAARIIFASILVVFLSVVKDWACETLAVVRLLSCSNLLLLYACCRARKDSKRTTTNVDGILAHPPAVRHPPGGARE